MPDVQGGAVGGMLVAPVAPTVVLLGDAPMIPRNEYVEGLGRVRLYDAGPRFADRYTLLFMDEPTEPGRYVSTTTYQGIAFGEDVSPRGFSQYIECRPLITYGRGSTHKRKRFATLPAHLQAHLKERVR